MPAKSALQRVRFLFFTAKNAKGAKGELYRGFARGKKDILPLITLMTLIFADERWSGSVPQGARIVTNTNLET